MELPQESKETKEIIENQEGEVEGMHFVILVVINDRRG